MIWPPKLRAPADSLVKSQIKIKLWDLLLHRSSDVQLAVERDIRSKARKVKPETVQDLYSIVGNRAVSRKLLVCWLWTLWLAALALWHPSLGAAQSADTIEFFEMRVRPLLAKNCFACHTASRMGGLEMNAQESFLKGGNWDRPSCPADLMRVFSFKLFAERMNG